jgi:hypothetical protein
MSNPDPYGRPDAPDPTSSAPFTCLDCGEVFEERAIRWAYNERAESEYWCCPTPGCGAGRPDLIPADNKQLQ